MARTGFAEKQRTLQRRVVARQHGKAVETEDIPVAQAPAGDRVVGSVGVEAGLEPGPGIHQLGIGKAARDLAHHGLGRVQGDLVLADPFGDGFDAGRAPEIGDPRALADSGVLFRRFDHPLTHRRLGRVDELGSRQQCGQLGKGFDRHMIQLDTEPPAIRHQLGNRVKVVIPLPIRVNQAVAAAPPPGLSTIDIGGDQSQLVLRHHQAIAAPEGAVEEIREVIDVVVRSEENPVDAARGHPGA